MRGQQGEAKTHGVAGGQQQSRKGLLLAVTVGIIAITAMHFGLFHSLHLRTTDFLFRAADTITSTEPDTSHVTIVAIDDETMTRLGKMTDWPRSYYAVITRQLREAGARVIAFDLLFSEDAEGDSEFATEMGLAGNVVLPVVETSMLDGNSSSGSAGTMSSFETPISALAEQAASIGHANVFPDSDGVVRRVPAGIASSSDMIPAFGVTVANLFKGQESTYQSKDALFSSGVVVPLDATGSMVVNYTTAVGTRTPEMVSFADVLHGLSDPALFKDQAVLIGATAVGLQDAFWTPCGRIMSGVSIHGAVVETVITGETLRHVAGWPMGLLCMVFAIAAWFMTTRMGTVRALASLAGTLVLYVLVVFVAFDHGLLLDMLYPPGTLIATFATVSVYSSASERARRRKLAFTFGRFVSTPVAAQILTALEKGTITLGGTQRQATVMFADIRGFTSLASHMEPQQLVKATNAYMAIAIAAVNEEGGMVNKFGGDSIMAVWNVPTDCPHHTLRAVRAALHIQSRTAELADIDRTLPSLAFGIGINTGEVVAGTFGAEERLEYSVLGDAVNVASRVTSLAPGGDVWTTEDVARTIADRVSIEDLGLFSLKGKEQQVRLFQATRPVQHGIERNPTHSTEINRHETTVTETPTTPSLYPVGTTSCMAEEKDGIWRINNNGDRLKTSRDAKTPSRERLPQPSSPVA